MNKKFTDEEIVRAAHCCTKNNCKTCPFIVLGAGFKNCVIKFSEYIANNTKNEPAPAATETSANVPHSDTGTKNHANDNTLLAICQEVRALLSDQVREESVGGGFWAGYAAAKLDLAIKMMK